MAFDHCKVIMPRNCLGCSIHRDTGEKQAGLTVSEIKLGRIEAPPRSDQVAFLIRCSQENRYIAIISRLVEPP